MLTGYNTDVSYGGEIFHIQTEDKGIHSPIILSLVYRAGTILAAKRTPYENLIQNGVVDEQAVSQLLNRQHQILVAAIQSGKSHKLAELSRQYSEHKPRGSAESRAPAAAAASMAHARPARRRDGPLSEARRLDLSPASPNRVESFPAPGHSEAIGFDQIIAGYLQAATSPEQLRIELLYPSRFRAGDVVTVRLAVFVGGHNPASATPVQLQVLGTKISVQTWQACTDLQGLASFQVQIPVFTSGAAALIIKATAQTGQEAEAKYMIGQK